MRNLKKILSLALALVMVFSLMTFASAKDFSDADAIEHTEAVEVLTTLEVIDGVGNNTFNPTGKVTRAQMAKMITLISLGNVSVDAFKGTTTDLNDIEGHWAEAFIKYCYSQGIISGKGNGRFDPDANVTTVEAAKMLLVAIGYNSDVQIYEGPQWTVNVIRDAQLSGFFDKVALPADTQINRDQAAQMMYNALNADIIEKTSVVNRTDGTISDEYTPKKGYSLLNKAFDGQIWVGVFGGNHDFNANGAAEGEISVQGDLEADYDPDKNTTGKDANGWAHFPYDYDIANIGEEVKVIFKDGTMGKKGEPDKNDTIYGVYKTGATSVVNATRDNVANQKNGKAQIKVSGTIYNTEDTVDVYFNFDADNAPTALNVSAIQADANSALTTLLKAQKSDLIKLILNDKNKVETVYVTEFKAGRVSSVTSSKVTIDGVGAIDIEDNNIYDGIAVDDVAVYTKFYEKDKDDAYFTVTLAETVEGALTGYKQNADNPAKYDNVVIAGTTYKLYDRELEDLSDDKLLNSDLRDSSSKVSDEVRAYMVNGMVIGLQALEQSGGKYALVVDVSATGDLGSKLDPIRVTVLLPDGTEQTLKVHKDSVVNGATTKVDKAHLADGVLIEYSSISDDTIKIYSVIYASNATAKYQPKTPTESSLWDKDAKSLNYDGSSCAVAASNAVLFVGVDADGGTDGALDDGEKYYAYDMRSLSDIALTSVSDNGTKYISTYRNDDGLVTAAFVMLDGRPTRGGDNTLYGIVTADTGYREDDGTGYRLYTIEAGKDEPLTVWVESQIGDKPLVKGNLVEFDEASDSKYVATDFTILKKSGDDYTVEPDWFLGAVNSYDASSRLLSYFTSTKRTSLTASYAGVGTADSITVASDAKFAYIDSDNTKYGDEQGIRKFNTANGYANILFHKDSAGLVDVIIYEVSGEGNLAVYGDSTDAASRDFGVTALGASAKIALTPTPAAGDVGVTEGDSVTLTVTPAAHNGTMSYVWKKNGTTMDDKTSNTITVTAHITDVYTVTATHTEEYKTSTDSDVVTWTIVKASTVLEDANATEQKLTDALAAATAGDTIEFKKALALTSDLEVKDGVTLKITGAVSGTNDLIVKGTVEVAGNVAQAKVDGGTLKVTGTGNKVTTLSAGADGGVVEGNVATLSNIADMGTGKKLDVRGTIDTITQVTASGTIKANSITKITSVGAAGKEVTIEAPVTGTADNGVTVADGTVTFKDTVNTVKNITTGAVTFEGAVTTVTDITAGTVEFQDTVTTVNDISGGTAITFKGNVGEVKEIGTVTKINVEAGFNLKPADTKGSIGTCEIAVKAGGTLTVDSTNVATDLSNVDLTNGEPAASGKDASKVVLTVADGKGITVDSGNKLFAKAGGSAVDGEQSTAGTTTYAWVADVTGAGGSAGFKAQ